MVSEALDKPKLPGDELIKSVYWEEPAYKLDTWRPFVALLPYSLFSGPNIHHTHGLDLTKNVVGFASGARGSTKSLTISYLLAKELRMGRPVWTNYPISFYVIETDEYTGKEPMDFTPDPFSPCHWTNSDYSLSYYESMVLDLDKYYAFSRDIRNGAVGITELQYFVESRTSGKYQNRVLSYQLMQIRKTANSFLYDVQNPKWVDNRFGWSADFEIECEDISKKNYDRRSFGRDMEEGEFSRWFFKDISGLLTGDQFSRTQRLIGPYQFDGYHFWEIYPTHYIVDIDEAVNSGAESKNTERKEAEKKENQAITDVVNELLASNETELVSDELWAAIRSKGVNIAPNKAGQILSSLGVKKRQNSKGKYIYDFSELIEGAKETR